MLVLIESTDLVFAVDSIPAIFAVTRDPFIVFTSNIFAILGLRALYFLLAGVRALRLPEGRPGLRAHVRRRQDADRRPLQVPIGVSLAVVAAILGVAVLASWLRERTDAAAIRPG